MVFTPHPQARSNAAATTAAAGIVVGSARSLFEWEIAFNDTLI